MLPDCELSVMRFCMPSSSLQAQSMLNFSANLPSPLWTSSVQQHNQWKETDYHHVYLTPKHLRLFSQPTWTDSLCALQSLHFPTAEQAWRLQLSSFCSNQYAAASQPLCRKIAGTRGHLGHWHFWHCPDLNFWCGQTGLRCVFFLNETSFMEYSSVCDS